MLSLSLSLTILSPLKTSFIEIRLRLPECSHVTLHVVVVVVTNKFLLQMFFLLSADLRDLLVGLFPADNNEQRIPEI